MQYSELLKPGKPAIYLLETDISGLDSLTRKLAEYNKMTVVRKIRGNKSRTVSSFFDEISAALQFPLYFGENWNAFNDCINDMDWLEGDNYVLLISNTESLLCEADIEDFYIFLKMITTANERWLEPNKYIPRSRSSTGFHVVLQCLTSDVPMLNRRFKGFESNIDTLILP